VFDLFQQSSKCQSDIFWCNKRQIKLTLKILHAGNMANLACMITKQLEKINKKVDIITKLVAVRAVHGHSFERQVEILNTFGFSINDISIIMCRPKKMIVKELRKT